MFTIHVLVMGQDGRRNNSRKPQTHMMTSRFPKRFNRIGRRRGDRCDGSPSVASTQDLTRHGMLDQHFLGRWCRVYSVVMALSENGRLLQAYKQAAIPGALAGTPIQWSHYSNSMNIMRSASDQGGMPDVQSFSPNAIRR
jgi:hypothetical protein